MTDPHADLPLYIDSTMISCFRSCPQKFRNEFVLGLRPTALSVDLHAGGVFAATLETIYKTVHLNNQPLDRALIAGFKTFMTAWGDFEPLKDTPKTRERMWDAVEEYFRRWPPLTDEVQPYRGTDGQPTFEFTFGIPLDPARMGHFPLHPSGQPFIYSGRFDMLGQWSGKPVVRDEKTTTSIGSAWAEQWDLRSQFLGYCWACQQSGLPVDTVIVRGIGILKTKFTMVDAIKTYSDHMIQKWLEQLRRDLWRLRKCYDEGYFDFNLADACSTYGGCAFRNLCASTDPSRYYHNFDVKRWNPLNKNPIDAPVKIPDSVVSDQGVAEFAADVAFDTAREDRIFGR